MKVRMKVKFMDWKKGDVIDLDSDTAVRYISQGTCAKVKPAGRPRKKKVDTAPVNKMVTGAANK